jgi:ketosteroid isomerase-like protein
MGRADLAKIAALTIVLGLSSFSVHAADPNPALNDETQIRALLDNWARALHDRNVAGLMQMYEPGPDFVAYDIVPPLQYVGYEAYKKDYRTYLAQYKGPITVEYRDLHIVASPSVALAFGLERESGTLLNGQKSDIWVRFTSGFRKIDGRWFDVHDHVSVPADLDSGKAMLSLAP